MAFSPSETRLACGALCYLVMHAPPSIKACRSRLIAGRSVLRFRAETGTRVELLSSGGRWLAVDERGRYARESTLSPSAVTGTPELFEALFDADAGR